MEYKFGGWDDDDFLNLVTEFTLVLHHEQVTHSAAYTRRWTRSSLV